MRTPAQRLQFAHSPFLPQLRGHERQRRDSGSKHCGLSAEARRMAVGGPFAAGLTGTVRSALVVNVDIAVVGMMMMFACADRRRDMAHRVRDRCSRRSAEREGRDQEHEGGKEPAQNQHDACVRVTLFTRQDGRMDRLGAAAARTFAAVLEIV